MTYLQIVLPFIQFCFHSHVSRIKRFYKYFQPYETIITLVTLTITANLTVATILAERNIVPWQRGRQMKLINSLSHHLDQLVLYLSFVGVGSGANYRSHLQAGGI